LAIHLYDWKLQAEYITTDKMRIEATHRGWSKSYIALEIMTEIRLITSNSKPDVPKCPITYRLEPLCQ